MANSFDDWVKSDIREGDKIFIISKEDPRTSAGIDIESIDIFDDSYEITGKQFATIRIDRNNADKFKFVKVDWLHPSTYPHREYIPWGEIENGQHLIVYAQDGAQWFEINKLSDNEDLQPFYVNKNNHEAYLV